MRWIIRQLGNPVSIALAGLLIVAAPVLAQDTGSLAAAPTPKFEVSIPTIDAVDSTIDEPILRAILSGNVVDHADELAKLRARNIRIPELRVMFSIANLDGRVVVGESTFHDIEVSNVNDGIAQSLIVASAESTSSEGAVTKFGKMSVDSFDIGRMLAFYGLVTAAPDREMKTIYENLVLEGGTLTSPQALCTFGRITAASVKARPLKTPLLALFSLLQKIEVEDENPSRETIAAIVDLYSDLLEGIETSPVSFEGFDCSGVSKDGKPVKVSVGPVVLGAFGHGRYPEFTVTDIKVAAAGNGAMSLGKFHFKGIDLKGPLAALKATGTNLTEEWFQANYRALIPAFDGLAFSDFNIDVLDEKNPGERIKAAVDDFDLTLKDYVNGIPSDIATSASHIVAALPAESDDSTVQRMKALGIKNVDVSYDVGVKWDKAASEIRLDRFSVTGVDLGSIVVASVIGQAGEALFSADSTEALIAALGLTLKRVKVDITDAGLADLLMQSSASDAGKGIAEFRRSLSAMTRGTLLIFLGGAANATEIATAVGDFLDDKKSLSVNVTSKNPEGVTFDELNALKEDPSGLSEKVDIEAIAN